MMQGTIASLYIAVGRGYLSLQVQVNNQYFEIDGSDPCFEFASKMLGAALLSGTTIFFESGAPGQHGLPLMVDLTLVP